MLNKKIIVAGAAGYIGVHLCALLTRLGHTVIGIDDFSRGSRHFEKYVAIEHDLRRPIENLTDLQGVDLIINLAAYAYVGESVRNPMLYWENNLKVQMSLLEVARLLKVESYILASSCAIYGQPDNLPINEECFPKPLNPYGSTKRACEDIQLQAAANEGFRSIIFRFFNVVGGSSADGLGEIHDPETHLLPLIIRAAYDDTFVLNVYGDDFDTSDGSAVRDYLDVRDLCSAIALSINKPKAEGVFNLGTEIPYSVFELIEIVKERANRDVSFVVSSRRDGDPAILYADSQRAQNYFNWLPNYKIRDSVDAAIDWYVSRLEVK